ncbi:hypothetical protein [Saccharopolyspora rectivirgula]|jgi:exonuclease VII small subunit|uniref:hypothetical protein n=1 Tax=Saccharopolyspora rectivirgula TaxID=28042 RepID=UPI002409CBD1|nr:hypothetical protein [Saccharopolyspora rectivirgula]
MAGFEVVPGAIRKNVRFLQEASDAWDTAHKALKGMELKENALGLLGRLSFAIQHHNFALDEALRVLEEGQQRLEEAATKLQAVAHEYESRDADYYAEFGYLRDNM